MNQLNVAIVGRGNTGSVFRTAAASHPNINVLCQIGRNTKISDMFESHDMDVVIDFSHKDAINELANQCMRFKKPLVIGTTGHGDVQKRIIEGCADHIPIVKASNFSTGMNATFHIVGVLAGILGKSVSYHINDVHHAMKKDKPSGTTKTLQETIADQTGLLQDEITVTSLRGGGVIGEHTVICLGDDECIEVTHRASSRAAFAHGALRAAEWIVAQKPGLYSRKDVLGF